MELAEKTADRSGKCEHRPQSLQRKHGMPKYDMSSHSQSLPRGGVRTLIRELGGEEDLAHPPYPYTGALHLRKDESRHGVLWIHEGVLYSAHLDGYHPPIALRLRTGKHITAEQFDTILDMPPNEVGGYVIENDWVAAQVVEEVHREVMLATLSYFFDWHDATWSWEEYAVTHDYVTSGLPLFLASGAVDERIGQWNAVARVYPQVVTVKAVPQPGPAWKNWSVTRVSPELETVLSTINGRTNLGQIASACGLTRFETARLLSQSVAVGIVTFNPDGAAQAGPQRAAVEGTPKPRGGHSTSARARALTHPMTSTEGALPANGDVGDDAGEKRAENPADESFEILERIPHSGSSLSRDWGSGKRNETNHENAANTALVDNIDESDNTFGNKTAAPASYRYTEDISDLESTLRSVSSDLATIESAYEDGRDLSSAEDSTIQEQIDMLRARVDNLAARIAAYEADT